LLCHAEKGKANNLFKKATKGSDYLVLVGPEGDFTADELQLAALHGFEMVTLGDSRLRTETAGFVACVLLNALNIQDR
jgi:16S rRNA (uracil1498-N3)-methyltransferase